MNIRQPCAYAGIGSRETPEEVLEQMRQIAAHLAKCGWILRSGGASGADAAFEQGCGSGPKEIYLPWKNFNQNPSSLYTIPDEAFKIASEHHPVWHRLSPSAKKFLARDVQQVLGQNLDTPVQFVACWTSDGAEKHTTSKTGGTGQAIRVAVANRIPVYNLRNEGRYEMILELCECMALQYSDYFD